MYKQRAPSIREMKHRKQYWHTERTGGWAVWAERWGKQSKWWAWQTKPKPLNILKTPHWTVTVETGNHVFHFRLTDYKTIALDCKMLQNPTVHERLPSASPLAATRHHSHSAALHWQGTQGEVPFLCDSTMWAPQDREMGYSLAVTGQEEVISNCKDFMHKGQYLYVDEWNTSWG